MRSKYVFCLLISTLALSACSSSKSTPNATVQKTYNSISGREGVDGPILAIKIDDTSLARPQIGLASADLVYIEQVEGGLTRLAAIFSSVIPQRIGPVRSARISDIDILAQFGKVTFAYSGAQRLMLLVISEANLWDYGAQRSSSKIFTRDSARRAPYNMVLRGDLLIAKVARDGRDVAISKSPGWKFGNAPIGGDAIDSAKLSWPASSYEVTWSKNESRWLFSNHGVVDLDSNGDRLGATTVVIQNVSITNSIYRGKDGGYTPFSQTVGTGTGYILRDGRSFKASWNRPSAESGTTWTLVDGSEIKFAAGSIWVALTANQPDFTLSAPTSPLSK